VPLVAHKTQLLNVSHGTSKPFAYPTLLMTVSEATKANATIKHRGQRTSRRAHTNQEEQRTRAANSEKKEHGQSRGHHEDCWGRPVRQGPFVSRRSGSPSAETPLNCLEAHAGLCVEEEESMVPIDSHQPIGDF
jgi:hypothetical protein